MIFGGWRGISFNRRRKISPQRTQRRLRLTRLRKVGDFLVEVGQGGFEGFAVIGVGSGGEVVDDARARELQLLDVLLAGLLLGTLWFAS
jgi:hypothetical protein